MTVGYDIENLVSARAPRLTPGAVTTDRYGRKIPKHAVGTEIFLIPLRQTTCWKRSPPSMTGLQTRLCWSADSASAPTACFVKMRSARQYEAEQMDLFTDYVAREKQQAEHEAEHARERKIRNHAGDQKKFGKNAILKGMNLEDGQPARERNQTIGGHQA